MVQGIICTGHNLYSLWKWRENAREQRETQTSILLKLREQINQHEEVSLD